MTLRPEQIQAREYLRHKGSRLPAAQIRRRVEGAFSAMEALLDGVTDGEAGAHPWPDEWSIHEVTDHLVETHRPSIAELSDLLAGRRPAGGPIPAGLQSAEPLARRWPDLLRELKSLHGEALAVLAATSDETVTAVQAPVVMVLSVKDADGRQAPLHWIEELDWKAYAIVFRLHTLDHLNQAKKVLEAIRGTPLAS